MKVLVIGGGGREHALAYKAAQSEQVEHVFVAPGNAGTQTENNMSNVDIAADDIDNLLAFAKENSIGLTIVGPEQPLVLGVVDIFEANGLNIFGPSKAAAQLEGSKSFSKDFLAKHNIPTAEYATFEEIDQAIAYVKKQGAPIVIKADGLAAGKGVIVAMTEQEAIDAINDMLADNKFGDAGSRVVIEEFLEGEEASFIVMVDGKNVAAFATSQDHKRAYNEDKGPNTGGMGAYSPAPVVSDEVHKKIMAEVIMPTVNGMLSDGVPYKGFLYAGLMIDQQGQPKVIEFNCRFGDPETQPIMLRLKTDIVDLCVKACEGKLAGTHIEFDPRPAIGVVMAAGGYPEAYAKGKVISGLDKIYPNTKVFHAGTKQADNKVITNGGRVLCVTSLGDSISSAKDTAYAALAQIHWDEVFFRTDIAYRAIKREN
ncbi:phosphoribosylamine--glycine ligase [Glaciecola petra]|uniref:Phosphoribosylamine--glycine ligase n=1 Tax=Glaciecola petra TaxID=3075602 RepID=A0ABU2ZRE9_9ALTE|nr:phosphoribosylamine--glycine ligase [Aestuariibacter sp. P117]MDT0595213.1 phosphoribosylamine--glycine ligase [Aestuariibacter sp. P117]